MAIDEVLARRERDWWRAQAEMFCEFTQPRTPPTTWGFVSSLVAHIRTRSGETTKSALSDEEAKDYRSFQAWYQPVARDLGRLVDLLQDYQRHEPEPRLFTRLLAHGDMLKERYRYWLETDRIAWLPEHYSRRTKAGVREDCNVVEYVQDALLAYETAPPPAPRPVERKQLAAGELH